MYIIVFAICGYIFGAWINKILECIFEWIWENTH